MNWNSSGKMQKPIFIGKRNKKIPNAILIGGKKDRSDQFKQNVFKDDMQEITFGPPSQQKFDIFRNVSPERRIESSRSIYPERGTEVIGTGPYHQSSRPSSFENSSSYCGNLRESDHFERFRGSTIPFSSPPKKKTIADYYEEVKRNAQREVKYTTNPGKKSPVSFYGSYLKQNEDRYIRPIESSSFQDDMNRSPAEYSRQCRESSNLFSRNLSREDVNPNLTSKNYSKLTQFSSNTASQNYSREGDGNSTSGSYSSFLDPERSSWGNKGQRTGSLGNQSNPVQVRKDFSNLNDGKGDVESSKKKPEPMFKDGRKRVEIRFEMGSIVKTAQVPVNIFDAPNYLKGKLMHIFKKDKLFSSLKECRDNLILKHYDDVFEEFVDIGSDVEMTAGKTIKVVSFDGKFSFENLNSKRSNERKGTKDLQSNESVKGLKGSKRVTRFSDIISKDEADKEGLVAPCQEKVKDNTDKLAGKFLQKVLKEKSTQPSNSSSKDTQKVASKYGSNSMTTKPDTEKSGQEDESNRLLREGKSRENSVSACDRRKEGSNKNVKSDNMDGKGGPQLEHDKKTSISGPTPSTVESSFGTKPVLQSSLKPGNKETLCPDLLVRKVVRKPAKSTVTSAPKQHQEDTLNAAKKETKLNVVLPADQTKLCTPNTTSKPSSKKDEKSPLPKKSKPDSSLETKKKDELLEPEPATKVDVPKKREILDDDDDEVFWKKMMKLEYKAHFFNPEKNTNCEKYLQFALQLDGDPMDILSSKPLPTPSTFEQHAIKLGNTHYYYFVMLTPVLSDRPFPCPWASMIIEQAKRYAAIHALFALETLSGPWNKGVSTGPPKKKIKFVTTSNAPFIPAQNFVAKNSTPIMKKKLTSNSAGAVPYKKALFVLDAIGPRNYERLEMGLKNGLGIEDAVRIHRVSRKMAIAVRKRLQRSKQCA